MEKEFFMKPKLRTKEKSVLGLRRNTFWHLQWEMYIYIIAVIQREFIWAEAMKLDDGQKPSTLIPLLNFQKNIKTYYKNTLENICR